MLKNLIFDTSNLFFTFNKGKDFVKSNEVEFFKAWINYLDQLDYKWPGISKYSSKEENSKSFEKIKYLPTGNDSIQNQLYYLNNKCDLTLKSLNPRKFDKFVLITRAESSEELEYINMFVLLYFPYTVVCTDSIKNSNKKYNLTIISISNFDECVNIANEMGFRQQTVLITENIKKFKFWNRMEFEKVTKPIDYNNQIVFIKKNVVGGYGLIKFKTSNETDICQIYKSGNLISKVKKMNLIDLRHS